MSSTKRLSRSRVIKKVEAAESQLELKELKSRELDLYRSIRQIPVEGRTKVLLAKAIWNYLHPGAESTDEEEEEEEIVLVEEKKRRSRSRSPQRLDTIRAEREKMDTKSSLLNSSAISRDLSVNSIAGVLSYLPLHEVHALTTHGHMRAVLDAAIRRCSGQMQCGLRAANALAEIFTEKPHRGSGVYKSTDFPLTLCQEQACYALLPQLAQRINAFSSDLLIADYDPLGSAFNPASGINGGLSLLYQRISLTINNIPKKRWLEIAPEIAAQKDFKNNDYTELTDSKLVQRITADTIRLLSQIANPSTAEKEGERSSSATADRYTMADRSAARELLIRLEAFYERMPFFAASGEQAAPIEGERAWPALAFSLQSLDDSETFGYIVTEVSAKFQLDLTRNTGGGREYVDLERLQHALPLITQFMGAGPLGELLFRLRTKRTPARDSIFESNLPPLPLPHCADHQRLFDLAVRGAPWFTGVRRTTVPDESERVAKEAAELYIREARAHWANTYGLASVSHLKWAK